MVCVKYHLCSLCVCEAYICLLLDCRERNVVFMVPTARSGL